MATVMNVRQLELSGSTTRTTETSTTIESFDTSLGIITSSIPDALLRAALSLEPENTLFRTTTINGRPLGDINNSGTVTSADSYAYLQWTAGNLTDQTQKTYIETVFNPYLLANPVTYSSYIAKTPSNQAVTFVQQIDNSVLPSAIYLKAVAANIPGIPNYVWSYSTDLAPNTWTVISGQTGDTLTLTNTNYMSYLGSATGVNFKVECSKTDYVTSTATVYVKLEKEVNDIINTYVTPQSVIVQTDSDGNVLSYSNTGTTIQVARNGALLDYGTSPNNFSIGTPALSGLALVNASGSAKTYSVEKVENFSVDRTTVNYPVLITNRFGNTRTATTVTQQYLKVKQGAAGGTGTKYITIYCFKWDNGPSAPTAPTWEATYNWSTGAVTGTPTGYPTGWTGSAPSAPGNGYTLYQLSIVISATGSATTTTFNWNSAIVGSVGFRQDGTVGFRGDSYRIAFKVTTSNTAPTSPGVLEGDSTPSGWTATAAGSLADGEYQYQVDGIYNIVTNQTTWGIAYLSNLKVGTLSAITTNTGNLVIGENGSIKSFGSGYGSNGIFLGWDGSTYKFSVGKDSSKIIYDGTSLTVPAATVTGTLTASQIAAGAITTSKLLVAGTGSAINDDPMFTDPSAWSLAPTVNFDSGTGVDGAVGNTYIGTNNGTDRKNYSVKKYSIGPGKRYRLSANLYAAADNNRRIYLFVEFYDQNGNYVGDTVTGWGGTMSGYTYGSTPPTGVWTRQGGQFGFGTGKPIPSSVRSCEIGVWFQYSGYGDSQVFQGCQDLRLEEVIEADLIVDGGITAAKIDSRGLSIKDSNGNIILAAGTALDYTNITPDQGWKNSNITVSSGTLQGIGTANVQVDNNIVRGQLGQNQWLVRRYPLTTTAGTVPTYARIAGLNPIQSVLFSDSANLNGPTIFGADYDQYIGYAYCNIYSPNGFTWNTTVAHDDGAAVYINGNLVYSHNVYREAATSVALVIPKGWSVIEVLWCEQFGGDGFTFGAAISTTVAEMWAFLNPGATTGLVSQASTTSTWSGVSGTGRPEDNATVGAVAGTNLRDSQGNQLTTDVLRNNLIDLGWWKRDATIPWSQNYEFNRIIQVPTDINIPGPRGDTDFVWYCKEIGQTYSNKPDGSFNNWENGGGWNGGTHSTLDTSKTYRFVVPIRRLSGSGTSYWGTSSVCDLNTSDITDTTESPGTTINGNPYFAYYSIPQTDRWYLFVGYIFPYGSSGNTHDGAGVWDCKTGEKVAAGNNWNFGPTGNVLHRAYQYYSTLNAEQVFGRPMINLVDGTEPSLREYFEKAAVLNNYVPLGKNLIPNSDQTITKCFGGVWNPYGVTLTSFNEYASGSWGIGSYTLGGNTTRNIWSRQAGSITVEGLDTNTLIAFDTYPTGGWGRDAGIPVVGGQRYIFSCYVQSHRCKFLIGMSFWGPDGTELEPIQISSPIFDGNGSYTNTLDKYYRPFVIGTAPAGAVSCSMFIRKYNTTAGQGDSYIWYCAPMFEATSSYAERPSTYSAGPVDNLPKFGAGNFATLSTITSTNAIDYIAENAIPSTRIANLAAGKITAGSLGVGQYIQSTSYSSGSSGWRINSDGSAEFEGIVIRRSQRVTSGTFWVNEKFGYFNGTEYPYSKTILIDTGYTVPSYMIEDAKNTYVFYASPGGGAGTDVTQWYFPENGGVVADIYINTIINDSRHFWSWFGGTGKLKFSVTVNIENYTHYSNYTNGAGINLNSGIKWGLYKVT